MGGGSVLSLLGVWRAHGIDEVLREAYGGGRGAVRGQRRLAVLVAGGRDRLPRDGAARTRGSASCPGATRCTTTPSAAAADEYRRRLLDGMRPGFAAEDGTALHFVDERLHRTVASRPGARAFRMRVAANGRVTRKALRSAYLGDGARGAGPPKAAPSLRVGVSDPAHPRAGRRRVHRLGGGLTRSTSTWSRLTRPARAPRVCLIPTASGDPEAQIDRFYRRVRAARLRALARVAVPPGQPPHGPARAPAVARRDLRGRRQHAQPARALAGARGGLAAGGGVAEGRGAGGSERRLDVLVRGRDHPHARDAGAGDRPGPAAVHDVGARRERPPAAPPSTASGSARACRAGSRSRTAWDCCSRAPSWPRR